MKTKEEKKSSFNYQKKKHLNILVITKVLSWACVNTQLIVIMDSLGAGCVWEQFYDKCGISNDRNMKKNSNKDF